VPPPGNGQAALLSLVCHDLLNPLSAVLMNIDLLLRGCQTSGDRRLGAFASAIRRAAERMNELLRDLADVSHLGEGRFTVSPAPEPLGPLLDQVRVALAEEAAARPIELAEEVSVDGLSLLCDRARVLQLFTILGKRAIEATPPGGRVRFGAAAAAPYAQHRQLRCHIVDGGTGISAGELPFVFDLGWHASERHSLSGALKLALARGIVEAHGGRIWIEEGGTSFCFTLPLSA
jgi:signal transduction histidine kinase